VVRTVRVTDPSRVEWAVRVVWAPRHRALFRRIGAWRKRKRSDDGRSSRWDGPDLFDVPADDFFFWIFVALLALLVAGLLLWWVVIPLLLLLLDGLIVFVLLLAGLGARILIRRPWTVEAESGGYTGEVEITGWRRALRARDGIANGLRTGGAAAWPSLQLRRWD
jgi:hypothetical protein